MTSAEKTPRTDAACADPAPIYPRIADFARQLERELSAALASDAESIAMYHRARERADELSARVAALESSFERECQDGDKLCEALNVGRTEGGSLQVQRMLMKVAALEADAQITRKIRELRKSAVGLPCSCEFDENDNPIRSCLKHSLLEADARRLEIARHHLNIIASWGEGSPVRPSFDEPGSAQQARTALAAIDAAQPPTDSRPTE